VNDKEKKDNKKAWILIAIVALAACLLRLYNSYNS
jgi:hypothetical protein